jgi:SpoVK/Ycf46/Vps4 family AAA+-type ATPase
VLLDEDAGRTIERFVEDARHAEMLSAQGVATRLGLLLHGAPGTGKSLVASHVAAQLQLPLYLVRLDSVISSRLGDTAKNIRQVFDFVPGRKAVLFLDEIDAIAKVRDDQNELGELKRVVNTVLQGLDSLQDETIVIGASNHAHILDSAIWRRFPYKIALGAPSAPVRMEMWTHFLFRDDTARQEDAGILAALSEGLSGADIENIALAARRRAILDQEEPPLAHILIAVAGSRPGAPKLVERHGLTPEDRRQLALLLRDRANLEASNIARAVGVSRQMVHRYLKEISDGD